MNRKFVSIGGLLVLAALLLSVNILAGATMRSTRLDLTAEHLYTLSDGTKAVLSKVQEPMTLRLYFSKDIAGDYPPLPTYFERVRELLLEYASLSNGKLTVEVLDPEPDTDVEDRALQFGLRAVPLPSGEQLYFGLAATNSVGDEQVIPFFQPDKEAFLEYDLTKLVYGLAHPEKPVIGVLSSLPIEGAMPNPFMQQREMPQPWFVMDQIRQLHETRTIQPNAKEIPAEVKILLVVHPKNLSDETLYAIDQFVLRGGKVLAFVDPFCEADTPPQDPSNPMASMMAPKSSTLGKLFDAWGVTLVAGKVAGDKKAALPVRYNNRGREEPVDFVVYLDLSDPADFNRQEVVSSPLKDVKMGYAGVLEKKEGATTEFVPLIETSTESMQIDASRVQFMPNPTELLADFFPTNRKLTLAARISGQVKSAFPDGKPAPAPPAEGEEPPEEPASTAEHLTESKEPIGVIVVADVDMLQDRWWVQVQDFFGQRLGIKHSDNGDFAVNALDFLHGSTDLVSLRGRGESSKPFTVVEEIERDAAQAFRAKEQNLVAERDNTEKRLNELLSKQQGQDTVLLSPEAQAEIDKLREVIVTTNKQLRDVRHDMRKDIENLGTRLKLLNIAAIPALVFLAAVGMGAWRSNKRKHR